MDCEIAIIKRTYDENRRFLKPNILGLAPPVRTKNDKYFIGKKNN